MRGGAMALALSLLLVASITGSGCAPRFVQGAGPEDLLIGFIADLAEEDWTPGPVVFSSSR